MNFYKITLEGMKKLLNDCNKTSYADIIEYCIEKWDTKKDITFFLSSFSENGAFKNFKFEKNDISSAEKFFWTKQLFSALAAMAIELARAINAGKSYNIDFIRKHFGHDSQIINGARCQNCGFRQINAENVDEYISAPIIAKKVVDGLETGSLDETVESIMNLSLPEIQREREHTKTRIINSSVPFSQERTDMKFCLLCGGKDIRKCKFLKSIKELVFVPLSV